MEKKGKINLTNEDVTSKFKSSFELVNYAIKLAENMIRTGRDARVKSEIQNRAMLILQEIHEGEDRLDDEMSIEALKAEADLENVVQPLVYEEHFEKKKQRMSEDFRSEE